MSLEDDLRAEIRTLEAAISNLQAINEAQSAELEELRSKSEGIESVRAAYAECLKNRITDLRNRR